MANNSDTNALNAKLTASFGDEEKLGDATSGEKIIKPSGKQKPVDVHVVYPNGAVIKSTERKRLENEASIFWKVYFQDTKKDKKGGQPDDNKAKTQARKEALKEINKEREAGGKKKVTMKDVESQKGRGMNKVNERFQREWKSRQQKLNASIDKSKGQPDDKKGVIGNAADEVKNAGIDIDKNKVEDIATIFWEVYYKVKRQKDPKKDTKGKTKITPVKKAVGVVKEKIKSVKKPEGLWGKILKAIAVLVLGWVLFKDEIKEWVGQQWEAFKGWIGGLFDKFPGVFKLAIRGLLAAPLLALKVAVKGVKLAVKLLLLPIKLLLSPIKGMLSILKGLAKAIWAPIKLAITGVKLVVGGIAKFLGVAAKTTGTVAAKAAAKAAELAAKKKAAKEGAKLGGKSLLKKIPGVGLIAGLIFAGVRASKGDWAGAAAEVGSGALSTFGGPAGIAASVAIDVGLAVSDIKKAKEAAVAEEVAIESETAGVVPPAQPEYDFYEDFVSRPGFPPFSINSQDTLLGFKGGGPLIDLLRRFTGGSGKSMAAVAAESTQKSNAAESTQKSKIGKFLGHFDPLGIIGAATKGITNVAKGVGKMAMGGPASSLSEFSGTGANELGKFQLSEIQLSNSYLKQLVELTAKILQKGPGSGGSTSVARTSPQQLPPDNSFTGDMSGPSFTDSRADFYESAYSMHTPGVQT